MSSPDTRRVGLTTTDGVWVCAAAISGLGALGAQVLYVRLFSFVFQNSTYTFAAILLVVLVALSIASALGGWMVRRLNPSETLVAACLVAAVGLPASVSAFLQFQGFRYFGWGDSFASYMIGATALVAGVVAIPMLAMGLILPLAWHLAGADHQPGPVVGRLTMANTLGAALGATGTSFAVLPFLDLWWSFAAVAAAYLGLATLVAVRLRRRVAWFGGIAVAAVGVLVATVHASNVDTLGRDEVLVERFAGPYGWTDVIRDADGYHKRIRHNIHYGLGSRSSSPMQLRQGHFPLLLHPRPERVAFIGMATGVTASAALDVPEVRDITVMELIPRVVDAARYFDHENAGLLEDSRVHVRVGDGRNLLGSAAEQYDVIVSDLFVPWESKTGYLYTVEHFEAVRERLAEGGVFCQWVAGWQVGPGELDVIAQSLRAAFPQVAIWQLSASDERPLFALVGVDTPRTLTRASLDAPIARHRSPPLGRERVLRSADDVVGWYRGDWEPVPGVALNTDEHPVVEFRAPVTHRSRSRLRGAGYHAYEAERLGTLSRSVFLFDPPASAEERSQPK